MKHQTSFGSFFHPHCLLVTRHKRLFFSVHSNTSAMGNDGGSIPTRRELVKEAARNPTASQLKETLLEHQAHLWQHDSLSQRPLARPIVSDALGRLFNKDSIIEFLLPADEGNEVKRAEQEEMMKGTVKSLKDVVEIKFEVDNEPNKERWGSAARTERWVCPITRIELGPAAKAVYLVPCGHAFAGVAVKEVSGERCLQCEEPYVENDVIAILPAQETDIARLILRMKTLKEKGLAHSLKKVKGEKVKGDKKRKKIEDAGVPAGDTVPISTNLQLPASAPIKAADSRSASRISTPQPVSGTSTPKTINNAATASLTARVLDEQQERNKRRKMESNETIKSLFSQNHKTGDGKKPRDIDFMNRGFAIPSKR
jgi:hypothetical protein